MSIETYLRNRISVNTNRINWALVDRQETKNLNKHQTLLNSLRSENRAYENVLRWIKNKEIQNL